MKDEHFVKLTKKQKLEIPYSPILNYKIRCSKILFIPISRKMDGYGMSASFCLTVKGWIRMPDYDCFRFKILKDQSFVPLKGDFEYGGVVFFLGDNSTVEYGNDITVSL